MMSLDLVTERGSGYPLLFQTGETWNGEAAPRRTDGWLRSRKPGDTLRLQIRRNDQATELSFALGGRTDEVFVIDEDPHATDRAKAIREGLLHGTPVATGAAVN